VKNIAMSIATINKKHRTRQQRSSKSRRDFVKAIAGIGGVMAWPAVAISDSPNAMLRVACIGVGNRGGKTMEGVASHPGVEVAAVCDIDTRYLDQASNRFPKAKRYRDWREMLSEADAFDAVTIGTPDHSHAGPAVSAIREKKHVYLEKPMAPTIHECRVITSEAAKFGVVTQLGNQLRSSIESRMTVAMLKAGAIGKVREVIIWENKPLSWWPKNEELRSQADAVPKEVEWDLWLGVREPRPYLDATYHPKAWRAWFDFGCGNMGDMGCHHFDTTFDALGLTSPIRVRQLTPGSDGPLWQKQRMVELAFPKTQMTSGEIFKITWHDGSQTPDLNRISVPASVSEFPKSGAFWIGEQGSLFKAYGPEMPILLPGAVGMGAKAMEEFVPQDHHHDWVDAILHNRRACSDFSHGGPLTEAVLVGTAADRFAGSWLNWDSAKLGFTGVKELSSMVYRPYRSGWGIAGLG
jgi:predicted dehydrogenase